jgi:hypothetical protein
MSLVNIKNLMPLRELTNKSSMFQIFVKIQALSYFEHHLRRMLEAEDSEVPEDLLIELLLIKLYIGLEYIAKCAKVCHEAKKVF